jgi:hypothetical protein
MTPKEKANELVYKHFEFVEAWSSLNQIENAKQCALITVNEIVKSKKLEYLFTKEQISCMESTSDDRWIDETFTKYWNKVKKEIKKL